MKAITVRDSNGVLLSWGPLNGSYDPGVPMGATKGIEDSYDAVIEEYRVNYVPIILVDPIAELQIKLALLENRLLQLEPRVL